MGSAGKSWARTTIVRTWMDIWSVSSTQRLSFDPKLSIHTDAGICMGINHAISNMEILS